MRQDGETAAKLNWSGEEGTSDHFADANWGYRIWDLDSPPTSQSGKCAPSFAPVETWLGKIALRSV